MACQARTDPKLVSETTACSEPRCDSEYRDITQLSKHRKYGRESVYLGPNEGCSDRTKRVGTGIEFIRAPSYILPTVMAT